MDISLRPATPTDEEFLFALFVSSHDNEILFFPEPQRSALMSLQFRGQQQTYMQRYPAAEHSIVSLDGCDAGRIWVAHNPDEIAILDIALMPVYRGRGVGTRIYTSLIDQSQAAGKPLRVTVSTANPSSLRFHERLGFHSDGSDSMNISLVREPG